MLLNFGIMVVSIPKEFDIILTDLGIPDGE